MGKTSIEWTQVTWNPTVGCDRISPGCAKCYAKDLHDRRHKAFLAGKDVAPQYAQPFEVLQLMETRLDVPLRMRKPTTFFVNSVSDLFHEDVPDAFIDKVFAVMAIAPQHTFQILTKRAERMRNYLLTITGDESQNRVIDLINAADDLGGDASDCLIDEWPLPNVWVGVSVENQHFADERIPLLLQTPAAVRFISAEPLLGPVDLERHVRNSRKLHVSADVEGMLRNRSFAGLTGDDGRPLSRREAEDELWALHAKGVKLIKSTECVGFSDQTGCPGHQQTRLDWVIVGGESGAGARPFDLAWARSIVQQCQAAGLPVFVKQLGSNPFNVYVADRDGVFIGGAEMPGIHDRKGGDPAEWPEDLRVREFTGIQ